MISPEHLIKHLQANATIAAAVGTVTVRGYPGVPVLAEIKADNIAGQMPRRAVVITSQRWAGDCWPQRPRKVPGWTCCATARTPPMPGRSNDAVSRRVAL